MSAAAKRLAFGLLAGTVLLGASHLTEAAAFATSDGGWGIGLGLVLLGVVMVLPLVVFAVVGYRWHGWGVAGTAIGSVATWAVAFGRYADIAQLLVPDAHVRDFHEMAPLLVGSMMLLPIPIIVGLVAWGISARRGKAGAPMTWSRPADASGTWGAGPRSPV